MEISQPAVDNSSDSILLEDAFRAGLTRLSTFLKSRGCQAEDFSDDTWAYFLGMRPVSDFFSEMTEGMILEIYDANHRQIYRNWAFFQSCGYTLGDLFVRSWHELYTRDQNITDELLAIAESILSGRACKTVHVPGNPHTIRETHSRTQRSAQVNQHCISPLFDENNQPAGYICLARCWDVTEIKIAPAVVQTTPDPKPSFFLHPVK